MTLKRLMLILIVLSLILPDVAVFAAPTPAPLHQLEGDVDGCEGAGIFYGVCKIVESIYNFLLSILTGIINAVIGIGEWLVNGLLWLINAVVAVVQWLGNAIGTVLSFLAEIIIAVVNAILTFIGGIIVGILMFIATLIQFILAIVQNVIKVIEVVALVIGIVIQIALKMVGWFGQAITIFLGIIAGINGAPATPIPGLPRCISAPMDSQICALWYMIDWTVIADGTPGAYIVPIIVLMIDIVIVVYVISSIMRLVKWFQGIYSIT